MAKLTRRKRPEKERFMSYVHAGESCWTWTGYLMPNGYGVFRASHGGRLAHRVAYRLFKGPVVDGMDVMHSCDNPSCVNPMHLSLGTRAENMQDACRKGRLSRGESHATKLSETDALEILCSSLPQKEVAAQFGIRQAHVSRIKRGQRWAHLTKEKDHR